MTYIHRAELIIVCVLSACSVAFGIAGKFIFKLTYMHVAVCSLICGVLAVSLYNLRLCSFSLPPLNLIGSYVGAMILLLVVVAIAHYLLARQVRHQT